MNALAVRQAGLPRWNDEGASWPALVAVSGDVMLVACRNKDNAGHFTVSLVELSPDHERTTEDFTKRGVECDAMWPTIASMCAAMKGNPHPGSFELLDCGSDVADLWPVMPQAARRVVAAWAPSTTGGA